MTTLHASCDTTSQVHPTAWKTTPLSPVQSGKQLRSNLLNKLGIMEAAPPPSPSNCEPSRGSLLGRVQVYHEFLRDAAPSRRSLKATKKGLAGNNSLSNIFTALASMFAANEPAKRSEKPPLVEQEHPPQLGSCSEHSFSSNDTATDHPPHVHFHELVSVIPIPRRDEYSERIRKHLWDSAEELQASIMRNSLEFAADGYNPQKVREEDEHILCPSTGQLIHPIHFELAKLLRKKRGLPEATNIETLLKTV